MTEPQIRFDDGAMYEKMMGVWSRIAGETFLDWLKPQAGWRWAAVGCGNGAFTELLVDGCAPASIEGVDPSEAQLKFARTRAAARLAKFHQGDAMALLFADESFDAAVMALVIFFVPEPAKGVAEMVRVVKPGGVVSAYAWDVIGGGLPAEPIQAEMRAIGMKPIWPPRYEVSSIDALRELWTRAGLTAVETREIAVQRPFVDFEDFWQSTIVGPSVAPAVAALSPADQERLKDRVRQRLASASSGKFVVSARANAVKGKVPG
jgi:ubiquinone/menaquinone biosynthesis C-methylase UbiE